MKAAYRVALMMAAVALLAASGPVDASEMDDRIESSARASYVFKTYLRGDDIKISSNNGAVTLTGIVAEESRKTLAQETVAGLPGVKSVDNRLGIKGAPPTAHSDAWVSEKVRIALLLHRNVSGGTTQVHVQDGIVTLRGEASSQAQKELTTEYAEDVEGVKGVRNEMTMPLPAKTTAEYVMESIDDASITAQVKMALLTHRSTSALRTSVETNEGVVTLRGTAKNAAEKTLVTKLVTDINGVRSIYNQMIIE